MKTKILLITGMILLTNCNPIEEWVDVPTLEKPKSMTVFCQSSPDNPFASVEYEYSNGLLVREEKFDVDELNSTVVYTYNVNNQLDSELDTSNSHRYETKYHYNDKNQLTSIDYSFTQRHTYF